MEDEHREAIRRNISTLVSQTDLETMRSALYEKGIFTEHNMETYTDTSSTPIHRKRLMYSDIKRRGPRAFNALLEALEENGYWDIVRMLDPNSILNSFSNAQNPRTRPIEKENMFVSISNRKKTENEFLNNHSVPAVAPAVLANGVSTAASVNNNRKTPLVVKKSVKFHDDDQNNGIRLYRTRGKQRGVLLVFTYTTFQNNIESYREGAEVDSANLKHLFAEIGLKVIAFQDLTYEETMAALDNLKTLEAGLESLFIVVSSHGHERRGSSDTDIRCSDGKLVSLLEIISYFSNRSLPQLSEVPKVFIFQICRGGNQEYVYTTEQPPPHLRPPPGAPVYDGTAEPRADDARTPAARARQIALYTNILVVQSTLPGFVSRRDKDEGSWYIQALCEKFAERAHDTHVDDLFTMVDELLKERFKIQTSSVDRWGFNRRLYLHPGLFE